MWLGVDTGGTFTDFVYYDGAKVQTHKVLSTPSAPEQAILQGIEELGLMKPDLLGQLRVVHGSTVATNAVLEGKGVRTVYITNRGLEDVIQIGRQARAELYNLQPEPVQPLIAAEDTIGVDSRFAADGELLEALDEKALSAIRQRVESMAPDAVAINLLFSYLDDSEEKKIEAVIPGGIFVSRSSAVLNEYKEYERGMAACLNAYVGPLMQSYLARLEQGLGEAQLSIMQSNAGTMSVAQAGQYAVNLLLSGPAGGLKGAQFVASNQGERALLSFDMGGTSTDVAMIEGEIRLTSEGRIAGYPVAVPMVDMHTIGAGGGSIARVDEGGMLLVGPESAGASPGPACYGKGGTQPTVTDANVVLGLIPAQQKLGGEMPLDRDAARRAVSGLAETLGVTVEESAEGILKLANEHMVQALRVISVQRGHDPRDYSLVSFGGAGGLHICALADALDMKEAVIPVHGGVLSAFGMLVAVPQRELSHTLNLEFEACSNQQVDAVLKTLYQQGVELMEGEASASQLQQKATVDVCYRGQSFNIEVVWSNLDEVAEQFHRLHEERYGHRMDNPLQLVNIRLALSGQSSGFELPVVTAANDNKQGLMGRATLYGLDQSVPVYQREQMGCGQKISGPALVVEKVATSYIAPGWQAEIDTGGNLLLHAAK